MAQPQQDLTFLSGVNAEYIAHLYGQYLKDRSAVDDSWKSFFSSLNDSETALLRELAGASWTPLDNIVQSRGFGLVSTSEPANDGMASKPAGAQSKSSKGISSEDAKEAALDTLRALKLIRSYRFRGHMLSDLDPLGMKEKTENPELDPSYYGFSNVDYDRPIFLGGLLGFEKATLREILKALREIYCGTIGVEYLHLGNAQEREWIQNKIEAQGSYNRTEFTAAEKKGILKRLTAAEVFEQFLHKKHTGTKRFGIDGGESLIPALEQIIIRGSKLGLREVIVGMAHRGRLNVLANVMGKSFTAIFSEFQGKPSTPDDVQGSGDVKYHLGSSNDRDFEGNVIHLSLTANPSHLEFVNPVVIGKVRAKQVQRGESKTREVLPLLLHGDAAFAGQGITAETLMISELPGYRVGGTVHIVINNQIGFTTMPKYSRSGPYPTDVAKMLEAPIFHVNGDDPEAVLHVSQLAIDFRQEFKKDVVIDIVCYRRFGHNEGDEPAFTQPLMYKKIAEMESTRSIYARKLVSQNILSSDEAKQYVDDFNAYLEEAFVAANSYKPNSADFLEGAWTGLKVAYGDDRRGNTAVSMKDLQEVGRVLTAIPADFDINKKLLRVVEAKKVMLDTGKGIDWATAEGLAFGTLLRDGYAVRLSGQDVGRGTFSHRHAIWYDQTTEKTHIPLKNISTQQPRFEAHDSPLSEMAVLGFEYGYSLADPKTLTLWEAQFGDFANGAQVIIDQFIASGESKWLRMSGLVLLLPHGYEGQGPEHSSARFERFLQLSGDDNWQVCNCTTPANYFHVLRRQMHRDFRKPLVIMTPKSLLRHKMAVSSLDAFAEGSSFHRVLWDDDRDLLQKAEKIKRVIICSGKIYYDLLQERRDKGIDDIVILRLEQVYPFPMSALAEEIRSFKNADVIWCQEEPKNQGAWSFVDPMIEETLVKIKHKTSRARFVGRAASASPATGLLSRHNAEQKKLIEQALTL